MKKIALFTLVAFSIVACSNPSTDATDNTDSSSTTSTTTTTDASTTSTPTPTDNTPNTDEWTIIPGEKVGKITKTTTADDLIAMYGSENVEVMDAYGSPPEEKPTKMAYLYRDKDNELQIVWTDLDQTAIERVTFSRPGGEWNINGCKVGMSVKEVNELNGANFLMYGFIGGDDGSGLVRDWKGGKMNQGQDKFEVNFSIGDHSMRIEYDDLSNDDLMSDYEGLEKAEVSVSYISVYF